MSEWTARDGDRQAARERLARYDQWLEDGPVNALTDAEQERDMDREDGRDPDDADHSDHDHTYDGECLNGKYDDGPNPDDQRDQDIDDEEDDWTREYNDVERDHESYSVDDR